MKPYMRSNSSRHVKFFILKCFRRRFRLLASLMIITSTFLIGCTILHYRYSQVVTSHPFDLPPWSECKSDQSADSAYCCPNRDPLPLIRLSAKSAPGNIELLKTFPAVCAGSWKPTDCTSRQNVAVLVPYRNRPEQLQLVIHRLHMFLQHQRVAYSIHVIEQFGDIPFNRGLLLNIGVREALRRDPTINCFVFHDVDLLPENVENLYLCDNNLRHLASGVDEFRFHVPFSNYAGGVSSLSKENFLKVNGFPNRYWGWGNEDDELCVRCFAHGLKLSRPPNHVGLYHAMRHVKSARGQGHYDSFLAFRGYMNDGLDALTDHSYRLVPDPVLKQTSLWSLGNMVYNKLCSRSFVFNLLGLPTDLNSQQLSPHQEALLNASTRSILYNHYFVDSSPIYMEQIKPTKPTRESFLWFLYFYGWI